MVASLGCAIRRRLAAAERPLCSVNVRRVAVKDQREDTYLEFHLDTYETAIALNNTCSKLCGLHRSSTGSCRFRLRLRTWPGLPITSLPPMARMQIQALWSCPFSRSSSQAQVRKDSARGKQPIAVYLRGGTYYLKRPFVFTHEDSGAPDAPVTYAAYKSEKVVISGGCASSNSAGSPYSQRHHASGHTSRPGIRSVVCEWRTPTHRARYPNYDSQVSPYNGFSADAFSPQRAAHWADPAGGFIHAMHQHHWGGYHYLITGKQSDNTVTYEGGWQNNRQMGMHSSYRYVENIFEELDAPGEWFHDRKTNVLYYFPAAGIDLKTCTFEVAQLNHLVEFQGSREQPAQFIELVGLTFRHTARTFMDNERALAAKRLDRLSRRRRHFSGAEDCVIADCEFDQVGGNAVFVNNYNRRVVVRGQAHSRAAPVASRLSATPLRFAIRSSSTTRHSPTPRSIQTPGPKGKDFPSECVVEDSLIHDVGVVEKQAAGVQISMSSGITVRHCSIYDVGRAGINISEGTFGGHLIEFCDVFDTVRETGDHGSFNSWGRDRFWNLKGAPADELPKLASLDAKRSIIRNSRWRCDRGWDVDLDDGSSNYEIYNNLFLHGGLKLREGFHRHVYNNIAVNNSLHPHVWYDNSGDVVTGNIWMTQYRPVQNHEMGQGGRSEPVHCGGGSPGVRRRGVRRAFRRRRSNVYRPGARRLSGAAGLAGVSDRFQELSDGPVWRPETGTKGDCPGARIPNARVQIEGAFSRRENVTTWWGASRICSVRRRVFGVWCQPRRRWHPADFRSAGIESRQSWLAACRCHSTRRQAGDADSRRPPRSDQADKRGQINHD